jgi:hypothetical protein
MTVSAEPLSGTLPIILDVEASGVGRGSYPIEIGIADPRGVTHCFLIRPEPDWQAWDARAEALHRISRAYLVDNGIDVGEAARRLNDLLAGLTVFSDGWAFDVSWVALLFDRAGISQHFRIEHLRSLLEEPQMRIWEAVRQEVIADLALTRHRASTDALIIQKTFERSQRRIRDRAGPYPD